MTSGIYKRTPEHNAANSKSKRNSDAVKAYADTRRGVPRSPEICAAVSEGMENSDAVKANADAMRGGNDICGHHYIYDHTNPELYTMKVTRSKHQQIHIWIKKAGIKVPHINVTENNKNIFGVANYE